MSLRRSGDATACVRCGEVKDFMELDRLLWCDACTLRARERAAWWGWGQGLAFGLGVAAYILLVVRPSDLVMAGWIATVVAAVWIGGRLGRELAWGIMRYVQTKARDPTAPASPSREGEG